MPIPIAHHSALAISPCINVCRMDKQTGLCAGCLRTLEEITAWSRIDNTARLRILEAVTQRRDAE